MTDDVVLVDAPSRGVLVLTLNSPKVNALSTSLLGRLQAIAESKQARDAHAVVVTGGDRIFAAGAEISEFGNQDDALRIATAFHNALNAVAALPGFVIAAVSGYALGGGCELALACDYRIGSTKAVFGQPEILLGIIPGGGGTQRLPRVVGASRAKELMVTGRQVRADEARAIGLVDEIVEPDALMPRALELATTVATGAARASRLIKRVVDAGLQTDLATGLRGEIDAFHEVFGTQDSQIGVRSFLEHGPGKASFTGE